MEFELRPSTSASTSTSTSTSCSSSPWFALSHKLGSELTKALKSDSAQIVFHSDKSGTILIDGEVVFDVTIDQHDLMEPYLSDGTSVLNLCGPVLGRCAVSARDNSASLLGGASSSSTPLTSSAAVPRQAANKMDMDAVRAASSLELNKSTLGGGGKRATASGPPPRAVASPSSTKPLAKKRKFERVDEEHTPCSAILRSVPLKASVAELGAFLADLDSGEMYVVATSCTLSEDSSATEVGDVFVVFDSQVAASLAQKRAGELLSVSSSTVSVAVIDLASEDDLFVAKGLGVRLPAPQGRSSSSLKSISALSKLRAMHSAHKVLFPESLADQEAFLAIVSADGEAQSRTLKSFIANVIWKPLAAFDETLLEHSAWTGVKGKEKDKDKDKEKEREMEMAKIVACPPLRPEHLPSAWNTTTISQHILFPGADNDEDSVPLRETLKALQQVKHLQSLVALASLSRDAFNSSPPLAQELLLDVAEMLSRRHTMLSAAHCALWRQSVINKSL